MKVIEWRMALCLISDDAQGDTGFGPNDLLHSSTGSYVNDLASQDVRINYIKNIIRNDI